MSHNCSRCDHDISEPTQQNANYTSSVEFGGPEPQEVFYGMYHTKETKARLNELDEKMPDRDRQAISAEIAHPEANNTVEITYGTKTVEREGGEVETAEREKVDFSIDTKKFDHHRIESPEEIHDDDDAAFAYSLMEDVEVEKTGLVCSDCTKDGDEIIWGPDK